MVGDRASGPAGYCRDAARPVESASAPPATAQVAALFRAVEWRITVSVPRLPAWCTGLLGMATVCLATSAVANPASIADASERPRAPALGLEIGILSPGPLNAITDVAGVRVGHRTLIEGRDVRTGVTAILPHGDNVFQQKVPAAIVVGNGFGKLLGSSQVAELGTLETPIVLTNTLSVFAAADALVGHVLSLPGNEAVGSVNPVVAETNDGYLNDIRARRVRRDDVLAAIAAASGGSVAEGSVGAGTGTCCFGWKGGIGTASRRVAESEGGYTIGVLVQSNFGGLLTVSGVPVGKSLRPQDRNPAAKRRDAEGGSCVIVVATDAPVDARQLRRIASRALLGLAATGSPMNHGSGDYVIAFSTASSVRVAYAIGNRVEHRTLLRDEALSPLFQATREATEEAIINSLLKATTVTGFRGHTCEAIPVSRLVDICRRYRAIEP